MSILKMKGKGYVKNSEGNILYKLDLPLNKNHNLNLNVGEVFVADEKIDKIECWTPPIVETKEEKREKLISKRIRKMGEDQLITEGVIEKKEKNA